MLWAHVLIVARQLQEDKRSIMADDKTPVSWLLDALCECGLDRSTLLEHAGISPEDPPSHASDQDEGDVEILATVGQYNAIYKSASHALNEPALGLSVLNHISVEQFGLMGLLIEQGPTMRKSLINLSVYQPTFSPLFVWSLETEPEITRVIYKVQNCSSDAGRHDIEFSLGIVARFLKEQPTPGIGVLGAEFAFPEPSDLTRYHERFGSNVVFDAPRNSISTTNEALDLQIPNVDPRLSAILEAQAKRVLNDLGEKPELVQQVETIIALGLGKEPISIDSVASRLHMHPRTLHRRLTQIETSFRQLKDNIVIRSAQDALLHTDLSVTDIALILGYSENSAFTRTFTRVCDVSPLQYRRIGREHI
jgi:AraC-like DNA-binding protein